RSVMGLFTTPLHPACARAASNWFPDHQRALANGLITGAALLAYALVHPIFGGLIDRFDWPVAFMITGVGTALLASLWFFCADDSPAQNASSAHSTPRTTPVVAENGPAGNPFGHLLRDRSLLLLTLSYGAVGYFQYIFFYWLHYYFNDVLQ